MLTIEQEEGKPLQSQAIHGRILSVEDGYLVCPGCRRNRKLLPVEPDTEAVNLSVYCRVCKRRIKLDIAKGQCFESQGR